MAIFDGPASGMSVVLPSGRVDTVADSGRYLCLYYMHRFDHAWTRHVITVAMLANCVANLLLEFLFAVFDWNIVQILPGFFAVGSRSTGPLPVSDEAEHLRNAQNMLVQGDSLGGIGCQALSRNCQ